MNQSQLTEFRLLKLRNLIANKEQITSNARREENLGGWLMDWNEEIRILNSEIAAVVHDLEQEPQT